MESIEKMILEQKIRFLACDILFKGAPQTFEEVCQSCRLFTVTPAELLGYTFVQIKFGNCLATALFIPFPGSIYVTQAYCQEIGRKSILTPFSLYQRQGGKWLKKAPSLLPSLPGLTNPKDASAGMKSEFTTCHIPTVDRASSEISRLPTGVHDVLPCPSSCEPALAHAAVTDREIHAPSNASNWPVRGSVLPKERKMDEATSYFASPRGASVEFLTCPSNCESASSQVPSEVRVVREDELGHQSLMLRNQNAVSSSCPLEETEGVASVAVHVVASEESTPRRGRRPRVAQKLETRSKIPKEMERESAQKSGLSSRVTRSATAQLPRRGLGTSQRKRERSFIESTGDKDPREKKMRGRKKGMRSPPTVKEEMMEVDSVPPTHCDNRIVVQPLLGAFERSEVVGDTRVNLSGTKKAGAVHEENVSQLVPMEAEAGSGKKWKAGRRKSTSLIEPESKVSLLPGSSNAVTVTPSSPKLVSALGRHGCHLAQEACPVLGGMVHGEAVSAARISISGAAESEYTGNANTSEKGFAEKFDQPFLESFPEFCAGTDAEILCENKESFTCDKSAAFELEQLLYISDSEENSSTAVLPSPFMEPLKMPPVLTAPYVATARALSLSPPKLAAGRRSMYTDTVQLQATHDHEVDVPTVEGVTETELGSRTESLEHLSRINEVLREMNTIMTSSTAEPIEDISRKEPPYCDGDRMQSTAEGVELFASLPCAEVSENASMDQRFGGILNSRYFSCEQKEFSASEFESCAKSHLSMLREFGLYDIDNNAAILGSSPLVRVDPIPVIRESGQDPVICVESGEAAMKVIDGVTFVTEINGLCINGASLNAVEKGLVSSVKLLKYDCVNGEQLVTGSELREEEVEPCADSRPGASEIICSNARGDNPLPAETGPSLNAHQHLETGCCLSEKIDDGGQCDMAVSVEESDTCSHSVSEIALNVQAEGCIQGLAMEEDVMHLSSVNNTLALVQEAPLVISEQAQGVEDAILSLYAVAIEPSAVPHVAIENGTELGDYRNIEDGPSSRQFSVAEVDHLKRQSEVEEGLNSNPRPAHQHGSNHRFTVIEHPREDNSLVAGSEKPGIHAEDSVSFQLRGKENVTSTKAEDNVKKSSIAEGEVPGLNVETTVEVILENTRGSKSEFVHPQNNTGPFLVKHDKETVPKEVPALERNASLIKIIDPHSKQVLIVSDSTVRVFLLALALKNQEFKLIPEFDNYTVIGEEGSGGYGTVYRVMNNTTERIYAMKCPLLKTHPSCVDNEIRMLQQLGGKECVIKFEKVVPGRFRTLSDSGEKLSECKSILLEFMEHDKPEVLKKEITVEELRNYCVCLFRALAHMHRLDEQKHPKRIKKVLPSSAHIIGRIDSTRRSMKRPSVQDVASTPVSFSKRSRMLIGASGTQLSFGTPSPAKPLSTVHEQGNKRVAHGSADTRISSPRLPDLVQSRSTTPMGAHSSPRIPVESPKLRHEYPDQGVRRHLEEAANVQENHTLGPRPQTGSRAILKYIQTNVYKQQQPSVLNQHQSSLPASQRKRVAAVQDKKKSVLDGHVHQIHQVLQPSIARRPKAPTKLKGAVEILEAVNQSGYLVSWCQLVAVAVRQITISVHKHRRSEMQELCAMRYPPITLKEWCDKHSRRPELKGRVPEELYDLLEKCLDVDPVNRITADEALSHQFCCTLEKEP
ncbi:hypothetical protein AXG93_2471s1100 [Marchantia polymorpha subsp. ruderalis]|uniref:Protein kinase domain-containing protein n=1 Tax=Marchantia polymorpha subsp. ruderalis TaxID=1480154 RepID=A0A176W2P7_MARPO|nr:hypothetical protein AXG93_2471s1100 [Marchantia polymorpha subsp. ruderalis]